MVKNDRKIGIGTNQPTRMLHINGDTRVNTLYINTNIDGALDDQGYKLFCDGKAVFEEVLVQLRQQWADYVFQSEYELMPLKELESFIQTHHHLPNIPEAKLLEEKDVEMSRIVALQMEKIEELTLYLIQLEQKIEELQKGNEAQLYKMNLLIGELGDYKR